MVYVSILDKRLGSGSVVIVQHYRAATPYIAYIELAAMQSLACTHTVDNHTGKLANPALWVVFNDFLHIFYAGINVSGIQLAQSADEDKLIAVCTERESCFRDITVCFHFAISVSLKCIVCCSIQRVLNVFTELCVFLEVWVGEQFGPCAFRETALQQLNIVVGSAVKSLS